MKAIVIHAYLFTSFFSLFAQSEWDVSFYVGGNAKRIQTRGGQTTFIRKEQGHYLGYELCAILEKKSENTFAHKFQLGCNYTRSSINFLYRGSPGSGAGSSFHYYSQGLSTSLNYYFFNARDASGKVCVSLGLHSNVLLYTNHEGEHNQKKHRSSTTSSSYVFYYDNHIISNQDKSMVNRFNLGYALNVNTSLDKTDRVRFQLTLERAASRIMAKYPKISYYYLSFGLGVRI